MKSGLRTTKLFAIGCIKALCIARPAGGIPVTYTLNLGNDDLTGLPTPFGTVTVDLVDPATATVLFQAGDAGWYHYLFGATRMVAVNVNGPFTYDAISAWGQPQTPNSPPSLTADTSVQQVDGWGRFNLVIKGFDGFTHAARNVSFTLSLTSGSWASADDVLTPNSNGYFLAAHVLVADGNWQNTDVTGYATGTCVPDGGVTATLLGLAVFGLGIVSRKLGTA